MTTTQHSVGNTTTFNQHQQGQPHITRSVPKQTMDSNSLQATNSFDSVAEMSQYFPDEQHGNSSLIRHQQGFEGQTYSAATSNRVLPTNINAINAASHVSVAPFPSTLNQHQPIQTPSQRHVRPPNMAHQQGANPSASRPAPTGIPSYESQVEGLSVDQTLVNETLANIQSKLINEDLQDYGETGHDIHLEPIPPIHIQAPQPTLVLQSDYNRLRAELNSRVRPPVVYRYPANANTNNQYQQHTSQHADTQGFQDNFGPTNFGHRYPYAAQSHI